MNLKISYFQINCHNNLLVLHFHVDYSQYLKQQFIFLQILVSLKCSMDFQSSDGHGLLLKYVSSYVTKMHDHKLLKGLIFHKTYFIFIKHYYLQIITLALLP